MFISIDEHPALQAEDNGFLMQLRDSVIEPHLDTINISKEKSLIQCIEKLKNDSSYAIDKGASLPLYTPCYDDDSIIRGYSASPVWAGEHVDIPLYGDIMPGKVEDLIKGTTRAAIEQAAQTILDACAAHPDATLADLYDPDKMSDDLRATHDANDAAVEAVYGVNFTEMKSK